MLRRTSTYFLISSSYFCFSLFFFNDTATTEIYTLSLHDALPISPLHICFVADADDIHLSRKAFRSEEHTSELQSLTNLVCRLLLEKKNKIYYVTEWTT